MGDPTPRHPKAHTSDSTLENRLRQLANGTGQQIKQALFGCQSCGNCLLIQTAFICPMTCAKGLRNGPCRGSTPERCFVQNDQSCTWFRIFTWAERNGTLDRLLEVNPPLDRRSQPTGKVNPACQTKSPQVCAPRVRDLVCHRQELLADWETYRAAQRQMDWWKGDNLYHPPKYTEPVSKLEAALRSGRFAISAEVAPPMEPKGDRITRVCEFLEGYVDAIGFVDNPRGIARMAGLACAILGLEKGIEPILQVQTRHRGRYDLQAEAVGASQVGVHNILCLGDDAGRLGRGPSPRAGATDLDTVQTLWMLRRLRDEGLNVDGENVDYQPTYFLGAPASPFAAIPKYEAIITEKKINAGAQFIQTMPVFDLSRFSAWMEALNQRDLLGKTFLIPTVAVLKNASQARFISNEVPGGHVPHATRARLEDSADPLEEGIQIALEIIASLKEMDWIHGIHILAPGQEEVVPRLVQEAGLKDFSPHVGDTSGNGHDKPTLDRTADTDTSQIVISSRHTTGTFLGSSLTKP